MLQQYVFLNLEFQNVWWIAKVPTNSFFRIYRFFVNGDGVTYLVTVWDTLLLAIWLRVLLQKVVETWWSVKVTNFDFLRNQWIVDVTWCWIIPWSTPTKLFRFIHFAIKETINFWVRFDRCQVIGLFGKSTSAVFHVEWTKCVISLNFQLLNRNLGNVSTWYLYYSIQPSSNICHIPRRMNSQIENRIWRSCPISSSF